MGLLDGVKDIFSSGRDKNEDDRGPGSGRDRRLKRKKHRSHPKDQNIDVDVPVNRDVQYHPYDYALPPTTTNEWPAANSQTVNNVPSAGSQLLGVNSNTRTLEMSQSSNPQYMIASRSYSQPVGNNPASGFQNSSEIPGVGSTGILSDHGSPNFNDGGGDLNNAHKDTGVLPESTDNICNLLRKMKSELPDVGFEREFVAPLPLADILVGICNLGNAYTSAAKSKRDLEEEVEEWQVKFQSLETKSREDLVRTRKGFGVTITNLEKDKARLEGSISTLKQASESLEAKQEAKIRKIEDSNEAQIRALNEKNAKQTTQLQRERDDLQNRLWNHEQHATAQMNAELNRRNAEFQEEKNRLIRQVADTTAELSRERSIKSQQITNIYNEHEAEKARMRTAHDKEKGALVRNLEKTIQDLQSALVRREHFKAMSDHELARHFQNIADEVDDFGRIDWDEGLEPSWPFTNPVFASSNNPRRLKQHVIQTTLWVILYDRIFCSPFRVLGNEGRRLEAQWAKTFGQGGRTLPVGLAPYPQPTKDSEKWRYEEIRRCVEALSEPQQEWQSGQSLKQQYELSLKEAANEMLQHLENVVPVKENYQQRMNDLVEAAAKLWLEAGQQRCRVFLLMSEEGKGPPPSIPSAEARGRVHDIIVTPGVRRMGNSQGERLDKEEVVQGCEGEFDLVKIG